MEDLSKSEFADARRDKAVAAIVHAFGRVAGTVNTMTVLPDLQRAVAELRANAIDPNVSSIEQGQRAALMAALRMAFATLAQTTAQVVYFDVLHCGLRGPAGLVMLWSTPAEVRGQATDFAKDVCAFTDSFSGILQTLQRVIDVHDRRGTQTVDLFAVIDNAFLGATGPINAKEAQEQGA